MLIQSALYFHTLTDVAASGSSPSLDRKKSAAPPPMDMMAMLQAKLNQRQKAISGKADDEEYAFANLHYFSICLSLFDEPILYIALSN